MIYIYYLEKNNIPFYIGKTKCIKNRTNYHRTKYGVDTNLNIIDTCNNDKQTWKFWESYWISQFKVWGFTLLNKNDGGGGVKYHKLDSINLYKKWRKDKKPFLGKKHTELSRQRISNATKGKNKPEGFGEMMRKVRINIPKPPGTGKKISEKLKGKPSKKAKIVEQYDLNNNFIHSYPNTLIAAKETNSNSSTISKVCRNIFKQSNGYIWKYKNQ
jgi:hypothetical protein